MKWNLLKEIKPEIKYNHYIQVIVTTIWGDTGVWHVARDGYGNLHWNATIDYSGRYSFESEIKEEKVVAWMYMPEPYKEEGDEEW